MTGSGTPPQDAVGQDQEQGVPLPCVPATTCLLAWTHCISPKHFNVLIYKMKINIIINNRPYQKEVLGD